MGADRGELAHVPDVILAAMHRALRGQQVDGASLRSSSPRTSYV